MDPEKFLHHPLRATISSHRVALILFATLVASGSSWAQDVSPSGEEQLQAFLSEAETVQANFYQELWDTNNELIEVAVGSLLLRRPNQFIWHYLEPIEQSILADGENLWIYDVELAQATVTPLTDSLQATPAMLLSGDQDLSKSFDVVESFTAEGFDWITLAPKTSGSDFRSLSVGFSDNVLGRLELLDGLDQVTKIHFTDVVVNQPLDSRLFILDLPDDVDLIGEPQ
jgi:outer membrane lipoprotein carrier protein